VLAVAGGEAVCVVDVAPGSGLAWGHDGLSLLFVRDGGLWSVGYDPDSQQAGDPHDLGVRAGSTFDLSPDGDRIVTVEGDQLAVRPIAGGDGVRITVPGTPSDPVWSPDGSRIAYASQFQIFTAPVGNGPIRQLTKAGTVNGEPAWTAEGDWVVFRSNRSGGGDLYAVHGVSSNGEEQGLAQVTDTREREQSPGF
jgi:dipeptidyl aminopeptidase/acylaminoacyl peptidase